MTIYVFDLIAGNEMHAWNKSEGSNSAANTITKRGMVLPFTPLSIAFEHVNYYVDMPAVSLCLILLDCKKLTSTDQDSNNSCSVYRK